MVGLKCYFEIRGYQELYIEEFVRNFQFLQGLRETTVQAISMEACALEYIIVGEYIIVDDNDDDEECFSLTACR